MHGNEVKMIRKSLGLTQENFAHRLGVSHCTVSRWETGKSIPSRLAENQIQRLITRKEIIRDIA